MKCNLVLRVINNYPKSWYNYQIAPEISLLGKAVLVDNWSMEMYARSKKGLGGQT